ncbi:MAG TPA: 2-phospho-L-lactate transferase [Anaerolineae bacterium]|nr:2-phospho-L-lactate transferase [Anaerolineae bacterium]HNU03347.1 2-phospho-L-lactate transferase [Anaerolineae bacterium]
MKDADQSGQASVVVALAGGVGGAKLAYGLHRALGERLAVVVNTGDDFEHWGLTVCPDLDTVLYNLAGLNNPEFGWGLAGESHAALAMMRRYGGESWFSLGDGDLATHLLRTERLRAGLNLTQVTFELRTALGVTAELLPMSDQPVRTVVHSDEGVLPFQRYFVQRRCEPRLLRLEFAGMEGARPSPQVLAALARAEAVVLCPSNPYLSLDPILLLPGLAERLRVFAGPVVAVSPIVGGQALKGPAAKIMAELGVEASALAVAQHIAGRIRLDGFVLDAVDAHLADAVASLGVTPLVTDTIMHDAASKERLAREVLALAVRLVRRPTSE